MQRPISRVDLLLAFAALPAEQHDAAAAALGYERRPPAASVEPHETTVPTGDSTQDILPAK